MRLGAYQENLDRLNAMSKNPGSIDMELILEKAIKGAKRGSAKGCAISKSHYAYYGPRCAALTKMMRFGPANKLISCTRVVDRDRALEYRWPVMKLGFQPTEFDKKGFETPSDNIFITQVQAKPWGWDRVKSTSPLRSGSARAREAILNPDRPIKRRGPNKRRVYYSVSV